MRTRGLKIPDCEAGFFFDEFLLRSATQAVADYSRNLGQADVSVYAFELRTPYQHVRSVSSETGRCQIGYFVISSKNFINDGQQNGNAVVTFC